MTFERAAEIVGEIKYGDWAFLLVRERNCLGYLQVRFVAEDPEDGLQGWQHGRKWRISEHMTESELVQTAWAAVKAAEEHEARERFRYRGKAIFGPHLDVQALLRIADETEVRASS